MEDSISVISTDSATGSEEYVIVQGVNSHSNSVSQTDLHRPQLGITNGDMNDLCGQLEEVLSEGSTKADETESVVVTCGNSKFYSSSSPQKDEAEVDMGEECTIFNGICYLGSAAINAPKSETEMQRNMAILNEQTSEDTIRVALSVPGTSNGIVVLYDGSTQQMMAQYEIHRIIYYARGVSGSEESSCFAFTWSHGDSRDTAIFQCHVFRCDIPEAVGQVSQCFARAFQQPEQLTPTDTNNNLEEFVFEVSLDVKEDDGKGVFSTVPRDRSCFKLRVDHDKELSLTVQQVSVNHKQLDIERCFGVLVAPGRNVRTNDMHLLEMVSMGAGTGDKQMCLITGRWDPSEAAFAALNAETAKETRTYMSVAVDLVVRGIQQPVRFLIETPVKIYANATRFWYLSSRRLIQQFTLLLKVTGRDCYEVVSNETTGELDRSRYNLALSFSNFIRSPSLTSLETLTPTHGDSDNDEPLQSGTGDVSKDCSADELEEWAELLGRWGRGEARPKQLTSLVRNGIPEALRGEVWLRLAQCQDDAATVDAFRILITKECPCESMILRDIHRTFPAHDYFKEAGGLGQDSLYRVTKAYAVHDAEVGYCQGISFVAAALLLHMPEEQAFSLLVRMMYHYGLRELYKDGFENLYMRLYQLNKLMDDQLPSLHQHLARHNVEYHMFASQWFLTVFTAKFPLYLVFHILDVFLLHGIEVLFQVALALLTMCKRELLQLDFEKMLKYFRVSLPKKCRSREVARAIIKHATSLKLAKKLNKFQHEYNALQEAQDNADIVTNEMEAIKTNLERCEEEKLRLEHELTQVKAMLKREVDRAESDSRRSTQIIAEYKKINSRLDEEQAALKQRLLLLRNEVSKCESCRERLKEQMAAAASADSACAPDRSPPLAGDVPTTADPHLARALDRIRELELELAQTKLERVQAECWKQELTHQLHSTLAELQTAKSSWIHKTLNTFATKNSADNSAPDPATYSEIKKVFSVRRPSKEGNMNNTEGAPGKRPTSD